MNTFPLHNCSMYLEHNPHKNEYQSLPEWIDERGISDEDWVSHEEKTKSLESDEIWSLQWYPDTPIGFCFIVAATLDVLLDAAREIKT